MLIIFVNQVIKMVLYNEEDLFLQLRRARFPSPVINEDYGLGMSWQIIRSGGCNRYPNFNFKLQGRLPRFCRDMGRPEWEVDDGRSGEVR